MRSFKKLNPLSSFIALYFLCSSSAFAQDRNFSDVKIQSQFVNGQVYRLEGSGGNIGISAGDDGILMIDDQFAPLSERIKEAIRTIKDAPIRFVLNTHWHGDHTGGNEHFGEGAIIIAHENVRKRLSQDQFIEFFNRQILASPEIALPVITFTASISIHFNGEEIRVVHFPSGHTDGDSVVFFTQSKVVHMGDHMFNGMFPYIDIESGGSVQGFIQNVRQVLEMTDDQTRFIPGHGPLATYADLKRFHEMLTTTSSMIRSKIKSGATLEQAIQEGLPQQWQEWGKGFINTPKWIEINYRSHAQDGS